MARSEGLNEDTVFYGSSLSEDRLPPIEALEELAPILVDHDRFSQDQDVAQGDHDRTELFAQARRLILALQWSCQWGERELISRIVSKIDPQRSTPDDDADLIESLSFMTLLVMLVGCVDTLSDRRAVVVEMSMLARQLRVETSVYERILTKRDWLLGDEHRRHAELSRVRDAELQVESDKRLSPLELIQFGEIDQACEVARWRAGKIREWERSSGRSPFASAPMVHLSAGRLDLFASERTDLLGLTVHQRIARHLDSCTACRDALVVRRKQRISG
jgi:hypothetical protein